MKYTELTRFEYLTSLSVYYELLKFSRLENSCCGLLDYDTMCSSRLLPALRKNTLPTHCVTHKRNCAFFT